MADPFTPDEMNKAVFISTVMMLSSAAFQQMGKLMDPASGKTEVNLAAAQATIDMLVMLQAKTKGNLDAEEERFLRETLSAVQMNYVETVESQARQPAAAKPEEQPPKPAEPSASPSPSSDVKPGADPKFHKSYG